MRLKVKPLTRGQTPEKRGLKKLLKPGYEFIIVRKEVKELLEKVSAELGFRITNQLLEAILREQFLAPRLGVYSAWQNVPPQTEPVLSSVSKIEQDFWCSGRDLNPRLRLERPEYLAGLYYRSFLWSLYYCL